MHGYSPNPAMETVIASKIGAAQERGVDLEALIAGSADEKRGLLDQLGITPAEQRYMTEQTIFRATQVEIGRRLYDTLKASSLQVERNDIVPCLKAYFEAVDEGGPDL